MLFIFGLSGVLFQPERKIIIKRRTKI